VLVDYSNWVWDQVNDKKIGWTKTYPHLYDPMCNEKHVRQFNGWEYIENDLGKLLTESNSTVPYNVHCNNISTLLAFFNFIGNGQGWIWYPNLWTWLECSCGLQPPGVIQVIWYWYISGLPEIRVAKEVRISNESQRWNELQSISTENHYHFLTLMWLILHSMLPIILGYNHHQGDIELILGILRNNSHDAGWTEEYVPL